MKESFISKDFRASSLKLVTQAQSICARYAAQGYDLSLRQLYYQFVAADLLPNTEQNYDRLGSIISDARLAGLIDWDMIKDRGRETLYAPHWETPAQILEALAAQFRVDLWEGQENHVEVMVEKQALEGVLQPVCIDLDVRFTANKGYSSSSALYEIGKRLQSAFIGDRDIEDYYWKSEQALRGDSEVLEFYDADKCYSEADDESFWDAMDGDDPDLSALARKAAELARPYMLPCPESGKHLHVIYLGDHDPSGIDMTRDVQERLSLLSRCPVNVHRIALNMPQVRQYNPPENPAKLTDSRAPDYVRRFGRSSRELDALEPSVLADLVRQQVLSLRDDDLYAVALEKQNNWRSDLRELAKGFQQDGDKDGDDNE